MKTGFVTKKLLTEWDVGPRDDMARTACQLVVYWRGLKITIEAGYPTDGASIPKIAWSVVGHPWEEYLPAAVTHDILCNADILPRQAVDLCFHDLMHVLLPTDTDGWRGHVKVIIKNIRLHAMYVAVRLYGFIAWWMPTDERRIIARNHLKIEFSPQIVE